MHGRRRPHPQRDPRKSREDGQCLLMCCWVLSDLGPWSPKKCDASVPKVFKGGRVLLWPNHGDDYSPETGTQCNSIQKVTEPHHWWGCALACTLQLSYLEKWSRVGRASQRPKVRHTPDPQVPLVGHRAEETGLAPSTVGHCHLPVCEPGSSLMAQPGAARQTSDFWDKFGGCRNHQLCLLPLG